MRFYAKVMSPPDPIPDPNDDTAFQTAAILAEVASGTLQMARVLAAGARVLDLSGLDGDIGLLCARTLDLNPADGRAMRPRLITLLEELDALRAALRPP